MRAQLHWVCCTLLTLIALLLPGQVAHAATFTVTNTNDSGAGSLRWAINQANANAGSDRIEFNIPGAGVHTIQPLSDLPALVDDETTIDGYSQPGSARATGLSPAVILIEIDGSLDAGGPLYNGLVIVSGENVVQGLAINRFDANGIALGALGGYTATLNIIVGNHIGTNAAGTAALGNGLSGVFIGLGASQNVVGGTAPADRNVLSANGWEGVGIHGSGTRLNFVFGNYIGTDATGTAALGNGYYGVRIYGGAQDNTVGGYSGDVGNVISGNDVDGVRIAGEGTEGNFVAGNYIGTAPDGSTALGNAECGVYITLGAQGNTIGGNAALAPNVISGNLDSGVAISGTGTMSNTVSGNYIGTDASGTADLGNGSDGVWIGGGAAGNSVGGDTAEERNVISGNDRNGVAISGSPTNNVSGNYIGTDASGTAALSNTVDGVWVGSGADGNVVGGNMAGEGNLISGNGDEGINLDEAFGTTVRGNLIGTDASGTVALGNDDFGIYIGRGAQGNIVGGSAPGQGNVIAASGDEGIYVAGSTTTGNVIAGNAIGTDAGGTADLGNGDSGLELDVGTSGNTVGPANTIAYNASTGVLVDDAAAVDNDITQNSIFSNAELGIDLVEGAHGGILPPAITAVTIAPGSVTIEGTACAGCTVEVFSNGDSDGEGEHYIGSTVADGGGNWTLVVGSLGQPYLTATATGAAEGTSEFSAVYTATVFYDVFLPLVSR